MVPTTRQVWRRAGANASVWVFPVLIAACGDQERPARIAEPAGPRMTSTKGIPLPEVSFDLTVTSHGGPADSRSIHLHLEYAPTSDSTWNEVLSPSLDPAIQAKFSSSRRLARIQTDNKGAFLFLRADGTTLTPEDAAKALAAVAANVTSSRSEALSANTLATAFGRLSTQAGGRKALAVEFVRSQADCDAEVQDARNAAPVAQENDGLEHHVRQLGGGLVDVGIDPALGVVKTIATTSHDGAVGTVISSDYSRGPDDRLVRRRVQIDRVINGVHRLTVLSLSKVMIDAQEVVP